MLCTTAINGATENARPENDGQRKLWVWKMQDWKMTDKLLANCELAKILSVIFQSCIFRSCIFSRPVNSSCAKHLTVETYTAVLVLTFILIIISIPPSPHSDILGFCKSYPP